MNRTEEMKTLNRIQILGESNLLFLWMPTPGIINESWILMYVQPISFVDINLI